MLYKKGDLARVYSLQSFFNGGLLNGEPCIVYQDQYASSVLVIVNRNFNGKYRPDFSYEVYPEQLRITKTFGRMSHYYKKEINSLFEKLYAEHETYSKTEEEISMELSKEFSNLILNLYKTYIKEK